MSAILEPDDDEKYLIALFDGADGLDLAECVWHDPESEDGCYRAWDYQHAMYLCDDMFQVSQGARSTGKTVGIVMRAFAFPFNFPGQKMLLTAPELNHLRPLTDAIEAKLDTTRIMRELRPAGKGAGITKQPHWRVRFLNNSEIVSRLPNRDGRGVKGSHVIAVEMDEAQNYPLAGWVELVEVLNRGLPGANWHSHGVPTGVRDKFFEITAGSKADGDIQWKVHRPMAMNRPTWSPEERAEKINTYGGSRQSGDYKRNIYGEHGGASNAVFVLSRLVACCDTDEESFYNTSVYSMVRIEYERLPNVEDIRDNAEAEMIRQGAIGSLLSEISGAHKTGWSQRVGHKEVGATKGYAAYYGGMDVGVTNHPSEILIFGQRLASDQLDLLLRVHMRRINTDDQKYVVEWLFNHYGDKLKAFGLDKSGVGFPIWDQLSRHSFGSRVHGFGFSEKRIVAFEDRPLEGKETLIDLAIERNVVEAGTDWLRNDYIDVGKMMLPYDRELLLEWQGQVYEVVRDIGNPYGSRRMFSGGSFHSLDAAKVVMMAKFIPPLEGLLNKVSDVPPVLDLFLGA